MTPLLRDHRRARARRVLRVLGSVAAALLAVASCSRQPAPPFEPGARRLNLVIVLSDALRASNLPIYGYPRNTAPNLTRLARESRVFDLHFANYPSTVMSVARPLPDSMLPAMRMEDSESAIT